MHGDATDALRHRDEARTSVTLSLSRLPPPLTPADDLGGRSFFPPTGFLPRMSVMLSLINRPPPVTLAVDFGVRSFFGFTVFGLMVSSTD